MEDIGVNLRIYPLVRGVFNPDLSAKTRPIGVRNPSYNVKRRNELRDYERLYS